MGLIPTSATNSIFKGTILLASIGIIIGLFATIFPGGHLPESITDAITTIHSILNWTSNNFLDLTILLECVGLFFLFNLGMWTLRGAILLFMWIFN